VQSVVKTSFFRRPPQPNKSIAQSRKGQIQDTGYRKQETGNRKQETGNWELGTEIGDSEPDPNIFLIRENSCEFAVQTSSSSSSIQDPKSNIQNLFH